MLNSDETCVIFTETSYITTVIETMNTLLGLRTVKSFVLFSNSIVKHLSQSRQD